MLLSPAQIYAYARGAGFTGDAAIEATAVALAESSGETTATSANPDGGTNVGLMQLDTPGGKGAGYSVAQLQDPATNMAVAYKGWKQDGGTFKKHWETVQNGKAQAQLPAAEKAAGVSAPGALQRFFAGVGYAAGDANAATANTVASAVTAPISLAEQTGKIITWLSTPANWGRVALVIVGGAVVLVGLAKIASPVTAPAARAARDLAGPDKLAIAVPKEREPAPRPKAPAKKTPEKKEESSAA